MNVKHALKARWDEAHIEGRIIALVRSLNREALGLCTIASCEGHLMNRYAPYVYFTCPVPLAAKINRRLLELRGERGALNYCWTLEGTFNPDGVLCFSLTSPTLERAQDGPIPPFITFWLNRRKIDQDLAELAKRLNPLFDTLEAEDAETTPSIKG